MDIQPKPLLTVIHFNDVYEIQEIPDKGKMGVCNFEAYLRKLKEQYPSALIVFSGDTFSPSTLSKVFEGQQMVYCLNKLGIHVACFGNHEFDFSSEQTAKLVKESNYPWILGNIRYKNEPKRTLGDGPPYIIKEVNGKKVGIFGVAGPDWLDILSGQYEDQLVYDEVCSFSDKLSAQLKNEHKCDLVIALGHLLKAKDEELASKVNGIDLELGGHDHLIMNELVNQIPVIKSGDDFSNIGIIQVYQKNANQKAMHKGRNYDYDVQIRDIPKADPADIDKELQAYVFQKSEEFKKNDRVLGATDVDLDTREQIIRNQECRYGNFVSDLGRYYYDCDICVINSGSIRSSTILPPYQINFLFVDAIIDGALMVLKVSGSVLKQVLEHSCKACPGGYAGSFLCVSGVQYHYDYTKTPRVQYAAVNGKEVVDGETYTLATTQYVAQGGDGYDILKGCEVVINEMTGIYLEDLILKFFRAECIQVKEKPANLIEKYSLKENESKYPQFPPDLFAYKNNPPRIKRMGKLVKKFVLGPDGKFYIMISPEIQGRIKCLNK